MIGQATFRRYLWCCEYKKKRTNGWYDCNGFSKTDFKWSTYTPVWERSLILFLKLGSSSYFAHILFWWYENIDFGFCIHRIEMGSKLWAIWKQMFSCQDRSDDNLHEFIAESVTVLILPVAFLIHFSEKKKT